MEIDRIIIESYKEVLTKMLERNEKKAEKFRAEYSGREDELTFHGGWNQGYWEGRASALGEALDLIEDL